MAVKLQCKDMTNNKIPQNHLKELLFCKNHKK